MRFFSEWLVKRLGPKFEQMANLREENKKLKLLNEELARDWHNAWAERNKWKKDYHELRKTISAGPLEAE